MGVVKMIRVASDKSVSHRAVILSSVANGGAVIHHFLVAEDTMHTVEIFRKLGVSIGIDGDTLTVSGGGITEPCDVLDVGNSGTGIRLITGLLSGYSFLSVLTGDDSVRRRPMRRIIKPLKMMGAEILSREGGLAPLVVAKGGELSGIEYESPVASAQVKSAIMLAGLSTEEEVYIKEPSKSRDHTERMLKTFGIEVMSGENWVRMPPGVRELNGGFEIDVPADISSAAFMMVFCLLREGCEAVFEDVMLNPTRDGILDVFNQIGARVEVVSRRSFGFEDVGDIHVRYTPHLKPFVVDGVLLPRLIDEIPVLSVLASFLDGESTIRGAGELRVKESDRLAVMSENLRRVGVYVEEFDDGMNIRGRGPFKKAHIETRFDHRVAMSFLVLEAVLGIGLEVDGIDSVKTSYPTFFEDLDYLLQ